MKSFSFDWQTVDKVKLVGKAYLPDQNPPKAVIALIHGHGEHFGRYEQFATYFSQRGIAFLGFDLRGHGKSSGKRGHIVSYSAMLQDMDSFLALIKTKIPCEHIFLYGHSMGANLVANYVLSTDFPLAGSIITSPWFRLKVKAPASKLFLAKLMCNIYPSYSDNTNLDIENISSIEAEQKLYEEDELIHDAMTAITFKTMIDRGEQAIVGAKGWKSPVLIMHGEEDQITSIEAAKEFAGNISGEFKEEKYWANARHELQREHCRTEVSEFILNWVEKTINNGGKETTVD